MEGKRADYIRYFKTNNPLALIEAKDNTHSIDGSGKSPRYYQVNAVAICFPPFFMMLSFGARNR